MICEINTYILIAIVVMNIAKIISHVILHCTYFRSDCCGRLCCDVNINHNENNNNHTDSQRSAEPIVFETGERLSANMGPKLMAGVTIDGREVGYPMTIEQ